MKGERKTPITMFTPRETQLEATLRKIWRLSIFSIIRSSQARTRFAGGPSQLRSILRAPPALYEVRGLVSMEFRRASVVAVSRSLVPERLHRRPWSQYFA